jgi:hypothetical protein
MHGRAIARNKKISVVDQFRFYTAAMAWRNARNCARLFAVMVERMFVILRYDKKVPAMACCAKCESKFFTPASFLDDRVGAEEYLLEKFDQHRCTEKPKK